MNGIKNQNIIKLKELSDRLSMDSEYRNVVIELKSIVDKGKIEVESITNDETKIKCYETMCKTITNVLTKITF